MKKSGFAVLAAIGVLGLASVASATEVPSALPQASSLLAGSYLELRTLEVYAVNGGYTVTTTLERGKAACESWLTDQFRFYTARKLDYVADEVDLSIVKNCQAIKAATKGPVVIAGKAADK